MKIEKEVSQSGGVSYKLSMPGFIKRLLENNQMHEANPVSRPSSSAEKITDAGIRCDNAERQQQDTIHHYAYAYKLKEISNQSYADC